MSFHNPSQANDAQSKYSGLLSAIGANEFPCLTSVVCAQPPFVGEFLLFAFSNETRDIADACAQAAAYLGSSAQFTCLREEELGELALPDVFTPGTFSVPHWLRESGVVLWGRDIRPLIPSIAPPRQLLSCHLEAAAYYLRNHVILTLLMRQEYKILWSTLWKSRILLMATALLLRGVWRVEPRTAVGQFLTVYSSATLRDNILETIRAQSRLETADHATNKAAAYQTIWLYECFLESLRNLL